MREDLDSLSELDDLDLVWELTLCVAFSISIYVGRYQIVSAPPDFV
jgi:hypothetical protein